MKGYRRRGSSSRGIPLIPTSGHRRPLLRVTTYVIFHAATWNAMAWVAHREAIVHSGATPILKLVGSEPFDLNPPSRGEITA
jgi:hypothetical protein